jgi:hypothetical protein
VVGRELGLLPFSLAGAPANLLGDGGDRRLWQLSAKGAGGDRLAPRAEHGHRAADGRRERAHQLVQAALLENQPLEPLVDRDAALEQLVLLVHEPRERLLGQRDERQLVGDLEHGEAELLRVAHERRRQRLVVEPRAEAEPGEVMAVKQAHELAQLLGPVEPQPGGEQQLAPGQPGRRIGQLRDVHPADRRVGCLLARGKLQAHLGDEAADRQHGPSGGPPGPTPRSARNAEPPRSPRTPCCRR